MSDTHLVNDVASQIGWETVRDFGAALGGGLLSPGAPGYDDARRVWNGMIDRRPGLIARCVNAADVRRAVDFARTHRLLVAVRGGDHHAAGTAVCDELGHQKRNRKSLVRKKSMIKTVIAPVTTVMVVERPTPSAPPLVRSPLKQAMSPVVKPKKNVFPTPEARSL